jgi:hypothetical protein
MNRVIISSKALWVALEELTKRTSHTFVVKCKNNVIKFTFTSVLVRCSSTNDFECIYARIKLENLKHLLYIIQDQPITVEFYEDGVIGIKEILV